MQTLVCECVHGDLYASLLCVRRYCSAVGWAAVLLILASLAAMQTSRNAADVGLSFWVAALQDAAIGPQSIALVSLSPDAAGGPHWRHGLSSLLETSQSHWAPSVGLPLLGAWWTPVRKARLNSIAISFSVVPALSGLHWDLRRPVTPAGHQHSQTPLVDAALPKLPGTQILRRRRSVLEDGGESAAAAMSPADTFTVGNGLILKSGVTGINSHSRGHGQQQRPRRSDINAFFVRLFAALVGVNVVATLIRAFSFAWGGLAAAQVHKLMMCLQSESVMPYTLTSFLMSMPCSRHLFPSCSVPEAKALPAPRRLTLSYNLRHKR